MQVSYGRLQNVPVLFQADIKRTTASISYNRPMRRGNWASTVVWGRDDERLGDSNAYLFESTLNLFEKNHFYTRLELVDKIGLFADNIYGRPGIGGCKLVVVPNTPTGPGKGGFFPIVRDHFPRPATDPCLPVLNYPHRIGAFTFGGVRDLMSDWKIRVGLGADTTFYHKPMDLDAIYGEQPVSFRVFLRFRLGGTR
jgi:hypothetical protein